MKKKRDSEIVFEFGVKYRDFFLVKGAIFKQLHVLQNLIQIFMHVPYLSYMDTFGLFHVNTELFSAHFLPV